MGAPHRGGAVSRGGGGSRGGADQASGRAGGAASSSRATGKGTGAGRGAGARGNASGTRGTADGARSDAARDATGREGTARGDSDHASTRRAATGSGTVPADTTPVDGISGDRRPDEDALTAGTAGGRSQRRRMPPVRLAPRDELAAAARVAPLLRAAADLSRWASQQPSRVTGDVLTPDKMMAAATVLELTPVEVDAAWQVVVATGLLDGAGADAADRADKRDASEVLGAWDAALAAILDAEELDGLATALYTVGAPVRIDALFEAYTAAAGSPVTAPAEPGHKARSGAAHQPDEAAALSRALETLADLGVVELGTEEAAGGLTVALSPLGVWGVHRRLRGQGWHVPVLGGVGRDGAVGLLMTLANCDAEDGEAEIGAWLAGRSAAQAARELIKAAAGGSPGLRGAAFAVLDRIGTAATGEIRAALDDPLLRAHAAVWLHEHDEEAELRPEDRTWLLVDLGAGLLEEADQQDVVAELLPEVPAPAQAEIVAGLWRVEHPGVIDLLTALSEHHPDPGVARAARKAAFKARSPGAGTGRLGS
jgi:hypothetical protein